MTRKTLQLTFPSLPSFEMRSLHFVKWPAPDLKQLIITIITHIVQQSLVVRALFSETTETTTAGVNDLQAV